MKRIAITAENSLGYIKKIIDIWNSGDCAVLIDWRIPYNTAISMMKDCKVVECYIDENRFDEFSNKNTNIEFKKLNASKEKVELFATDIYDKFKENYSSDEALIIFSSGTTGKSKGIIMSHYAINTNADAIISYMKLEKNDCLGLVKPLCHSSTIVGELLVALKSHTKAAISKSIVSPRIISQNFKKFGVTIICINPVLLSLYTHEHNFVEMNVKKIYVSGSILSTKVLNIAKKAFPNTHIYNVYGQTEAGPRVTAQDDQNCNNNSTGRCIKGVEIKIIDTAGKEVKKGKIGIIHVLTKSKFTGYVSGKNTESLYKNWLNTKDLGYIGKDDQLYVCGRIDDLIISSSHKVYPSNVEKVIEENINIDTAIVLGILDEKYGQKIVCFYKLKEKGIVDKKSILEFTRKRLPSYEIPQEWIEIEKVPYVINGKVDRKELKKIYDKK